MKSQLLTILLLTIGAHLFQSTHQYRIEKRELTENDLSSFIVHSCSAEKVDKLMISLCYQTYHAAIEGKYPSLASYCRVIGSGYRYCYYINQNTLNTDVEKSSSRRFVRSLNKAKKSYRNEQKIDIDIDLEENMFVQMCTIKTPVEAQSFCNRTLPAIQQGQYPKIKYLCQTHPDFNYCQDILSFSSLFTRPVSKESSSFLSSLPTSHLSSVPLTIMDEEKMNENTNKSS